MSQRPAGLTGSLFTSRASVRWLTILCLAGVTIGVVAGVLVARWQPPGASFALATAEVVVRAWTNAFRVLVAPLVMAQLYVAVSENRGTGSAGRLGLSIPIVFASLLALTALLGLLATPMLVALPWFPDLSLTTTGAPVDVAAPASVGVAWIDGFIPPNLFAAATTDNILPLMLFSLTFALAMRRADAESAAVMYRLVRGVAQASFTIVGWLLVVTPIVLLALGFRSAMNSGMTVGGVILGFATLEIVVVLLTMMMLYFIAMAIGGVSLGRFARALWPAQLTAIATRSSLATLPALMTAATTTLRLRAETAAAVLPMGGATLKISRAISGPVKLLFLAHVLGIEITVERLIIFAVTIILLSATTVGVPTVKSGNRSLPAYVAAGVPAEYVVLLSVAVSLTDIFLTMVNTTGYLTAATVIDRFGYARKREKEQPAEAEPEPQPAAHVA